MALGDGTHKGHDLGKLAEAFGVADEVLADLESIARNGLRLPAENGEAAVDLEPDVEHADRIAAQIKVVEEVRGFFQAVKDKVRLHDGNPSA